MENFDMKTNFKYLDPSYKNEVLATAILGREQEIFHYELNIDNYQHVIDNAKDSLVKTEFAKRIVSEQRELEKALSIYKALLAQVSDPIELDLVVAKIKTKSV